MPQGCSTSGLTRRVGVVSLVELERVMHNLRITPRRKAGRPCSEAFAVRGFMRWRPVCALVPVQCGPRWQTLRWRH